MTEPSSSAVAGWATESFTNAGITHDLYTRGSGPGVVLLPEIPGMTPEVMGLADHLVGAGFTVTVISLFGDRPVAEYVRAVARRVHDRVGGPGVGVIGMCFSGGFALASAVDPVVLAPVASQPSLPMPVTAGRRRDLGMSDRERDAISARVQTEGLCLMGLRFSEDSASPTDRFRSLRAAFGDGWLPIALNSRPGNAAGIGENEHMVLTSKDADTPGHPTHEARAQVTAFLRERLGVKAAAEG